MRLYYATGTCSLASHIVALEAGIAIEPVRVDIKASPHLLEDGSAYADINPKGYVPALELEDGTLLSEGTAIMLHLGDRNPESTILPRPGTRERDLEHQWLVFIATELHKMYSPWLFHPEYDAPNAEKIARGKIAARLALVEERLGTNAWLVGDHFTAADAYLFTIVGWSTYARIDLEPFPALRRFMTQTAARPAVRAAMKAQGMAA